MKVQNIPSLYLRELETPNSDAQENQNMNVRSAHGEVFRDSGAPRTGVAKSVSLKNSGVSNPRMSEVPNQPRFQNSHKPEILRFKKASPCEVQIRESTETKGGL
ncbi:hypothetical protein SUGI_0496900 [Cryptomeria japonica]|nr:hypothetical protein SUGI_0496900 [Cryptomeria japonica]